MTSNQEKDSASFGLIISCIIIPLGLMLIYFGFKNMGREGVNTETSNYEYKFPRTFKKVTHPFQITAFDSWGTLITGTILLFIGLRIILRRIVQKK